jgi:predicted transposase YdaD
MRRIDDRFYEEVIEDLGSRPVRARAAEGRSPGEAGRAKMERFEARANERERKLKAAVAKISAELDIERKQSRTRQMQLEEALERLATAERRARQAAEDVTR